MGTRTRTRHDEARACYVAGREEAHQAGDPVRSALVLRDHSYLETWVGRPGLIDCQTIVAVGAVTGRPAG